MSSLTSLLLRIKLYARSKKKNQHRMCQHPTCSLMSPVIAKGSLRKIHVIAFPSAYGISISYTKMFTNDYADTPPPHKSTISRATTAALHIPIYRPYSVLQQRISTLGDAKSHQDISSMIGSTRSQSTPPINAFFFHRQTHTHRLGAVLTTRRHSIDYAMHRRNFHLLNRKASWIW